MKDPIARYVAIFAIVVSIFSFGLSYRDFRASRSEEYARARSATMLAMLESITLVSQLERLTKYCLHSTKDKKEREDFSALWASATEMRTSMDNIVKKMIDIGEVSVEGAVSEVRQIKDMTEINNRNMRSQIESLKSLECSRQTQDNNSLEPTAGL